MAGFGSESYLSSSCPVWPACDQGLQRIPGFWFWASLKRKRFRGFLEVPRCSSSFSVTRQTSLHCLEKLWSFRICLACSSTDEIVGLLSGRKPSLVLVWAAVSNLTVSCNDWVTLRWALQWLLVAEGKVMCKPYRWRAHTPVLGAHAIFHSYHFIFYNICGFSKLELRKFK